MKFLKSCDFVHCFYNIQKNGTDCAIVKSNGTIALNVREILKEVSSFNVFIVS